MTYTIDEQINIKIGENLQVGQNTSIGCKPFHFSHIDNIYREQYSGRKPTFNIEIGNNVFIGSNCTIQSGFWDVTKIGDYAKIDHSCGIAHDCKVGDRVVLTLGTKLAGRVEVGEDTYFGIGSLVKPKVKVGKRCLIGMGSIVTKDIPDGVIAMNKIIGDKVYCVPVKENKWYPPDSLDIYPNQPHG